ncbi:MAG: transcription factor WhiB [Pseudomonas sp.]|nr:transcription factor WhiB [Pseudomonas sp.]
MTGSQLVHGQFRPEPWMERGLCREIPDPDGFYPNPGDSKTAAEAKAVCRLCQVRQECLDYAIEHREVHGVWGASTPRERNRMLRGQP